MQWTPKHEKLTVGEERVIVKFLWLPKKLGKVVKWFEHAPIKQRVLAVDVGGSSEWGKYKNQWVDREWASWTDTRRTV